MAAVKAPKRDRITVDAARVEGRCICEGCPACRGEPGYPCGFIAWTVNRERCRYCR